MSRSWYHRYGRQVEPFYIQLLSPSSMDDFIPRSSVSCNVDQLTRHWRLLPRWSSLPTDVLYSELYPAILCSRRRPRFPRYNLTYHPIWEYLTHMSDQWSWLLFDHKQWPNRIGITSRLWPWVRLRFGFQSPYSPIVQTPRVHHTCIVSSNEYEDWSIRSLAIVDLNHFSSRQQFDGCVATLPSTMCEVSGGRVGTCCWLVGRLDRDR